MSVQFITREAAQERLDEMLGCTIEFAGKSPDTELYIFEFSNSQTAGDITEPTEARCIFKLHLLCRFEVIWRKRKTTDIYYEDTSSEEFASQASQLMGKPIKRTGLSDKNDLWLDFGDFWMVFATFENEEESWRFFTPIKRNPTLSRQIPGLNLSIDIPYSRMKAGPEKNSLARFLGGIYIVNWMAQKAA